MGERADQLNDYEQTPYIPGGSMPQGDEWSEPPSGETATGGSFAVATDAAASDVASGKTSTRKRASGDLGTIGIGSDVDMDARVQATDTVSQAAMPAKDTAAQKLQDVTSQVSEKASPVVQQAAAQARQLSDQAQQQARMVRDKYYDWQDRTGIEITPRMLGIAAGVLAGVIALIAVIGRLRGQTVEDEDVIVADLPLDDLPNGKYQITRIE